VPASPHIAAIDALIVKRSGDVVLGVNFYASQNRGCQSLRVEVTAAGRLTVLSRSGADRTCG
jgi:hypothetical protein